MHLTAERLQPKDRAEWLALRRTDVTASQISALVSVHPYCTAYQLWAEKTGKLVPDDDLDSPAMRRGRLLEKVGVELAAEALPQAELFHNSGTPQYWRLPEARIGATPDVLVTDSRGLGVIQLKSIDPWVYRQSWADHEPPLWIALQALTEAKLTGAQWAAVGALRVGIAAEFDLTPIPLHEGAWQTLQDAVGEFWRSVQADTPPQPDFKRDADVIAALHPASDASRIDLSDDLELIAAIARRQRFKSELSDLGKQCDEIDAMIRHKAAEHEIITAGNFRVTLKTEQVKAYTVAARSRRPIRVKQKSSNEVAE
jgi:predicted phage-related endonuclease